MHLKQVLSDINILWLSHWQELLIRIILGGQSYDTSEEIIGVWELLFKVGI
jgi:hypothetical protein